jgi:signal transduction histidine kinase
VIYFGGGLIAWLIEVRIASGFSILLWVFYGQAFGLLPPAGVVPVVTLIQFIFLGSAVDWDLARVQPGLVLGVGLSWVSTLVGYWFIYNAVQTSHERGRLVMELEAARRDLEAARQSDAELAALRERERLARDMHDSLGHALAALSVQLEAAQRLIRRDPERAAAQMDDMKALTRQSMDALRRTLAGLRAPGLGERPLRHAIQEACIAASQRSGMTVNCSIAPEADGLSRAVAEALWGVTQEALTNVEKHAAARHAEVVLDVLPREVRLSVQDDGVGLPADAFTRAGHYGLRGMRERVEGIGGALRIAPAAPSGTLVEASVPLI